jgi:predicted ATPase
MRTSHLPLQSFRLKNFKAVRDSGLIRFTPLTVFIGNNGSGKSSVIEGLEMLKHIAASGIDTALRPWLGFEHIWNKAANHIQTIDGAGNICVSNPMTFCVKGKSALNHENYKIELSLGMDDKGNKVFVQHYRILSHDRKPHQGLMDDGTPEYQMAMDDKLPMITAAWQFITLSPQDMLYPHPQKRTRGAIGLKKDGANIAEFLQNIRDDDVDVFNDLIELERNVYLTLKEKGIEDKLPGWLLSQGTLRILALLCVFRHPAPPSVIVIEEIENGLDPRTIHMLVNEIRAFVQSGKGQVIATTHSPYLLDLLPLSQIIVVERDEEGSPIFHRPSEDKELSIWAEKFAPGKLYTMGNMTRR